MSAKIRPIWLAIFNFMQFKTRANILKMKKIGQLITLLILFSCVKEDPRDSNNGLVKKEFINAVDISGYPEIALSTPSFYDLEGNQNDFLAILKNNGVQTVRLIMWVYPSSTHSGFEEVKLFSETLKRKGFKIWLALHYSDTWADPGHQETPLQWSGLDFSALKDSLYNYTRRVVKSIDPSYIQIGNEINSGLLHPQGEISTNFQNFIRLLEAGISALRENSEDCKIILHYAGITGSNQFFSQLTSVNYDIIGLSYYPIWHGKSLDTLATSLRNLSEKYNKAVVIAETAYPFTLAWNDWTNNIIGSSEQLILPDYPATAAGQRKFIKDLKNRIVALEKGIGLCYWGAELIAWKGNQSSSASPWENQALFNFDNEALPVLKEFKIE